MIKPIEIDFKENFIVFRYKGDDSIVFKTKKNIFQENTGVTISNPDVDIPAYVLELSQYGENLVCGHIIDNIVGYLKNAELENILLIVDFSGVINISENFAEQYLKFVLSTKSKVLGININTNINNALSAYIEDIIVPKEVEQS